MTCSCLQRQQLLDLGVSFIILEVVVATAGAIYLQIPVLYTNLIYLVTIIIIKQFIPQQILKNEKSNL